MKEEAHSRRRESDLHERECESLRQRMDLYDLSSLLLPIFRIVELKVPNFFPDYLAKGPITWLLDFPIMLKQAFPQLEDFDFSDPSHSGWLQLMVKKCIGKAWQQKYPLSNRCDNLLWDPCQPLDNNRSGTVIFAPNTFQAELVLSLLDYWDLLYRNVLCDKYKSSLRESIELDNESCVALTVSDAEYLLNSALHNWACVDSPLRVAAMKKAGGYLNRLTVEILMAEESRVYDFAKSFEALSEDLVELKKMKDQAREKRTILKYRMNKCKELEDVIFDEVTEATEECPCFKVSRTYDEFNYIFPYVKDGGDINDLRRVKWYFKKTNSLTLYARRWSEVEAVKIELDDIKRGIKEREGFADLRAGECFHLRWLPCEALRSHIYSLKRLSLLGHFPKGLKDKKDNRLSISVFSAATKAGILMGDS